LAAQSGQTEIQNRKEYDMTMKLLLLISLFVGALTTTRAASTSAPLSPLIKSWLAGQTNVQTWSASFVQTRTLKSLTEPLTATGQVWFAAPSRFRWELGQPPETIAVRTVTNLLIVYPHLKRVERFPLTGKQAGPWRDLLAMLDAGFPHRATDLQDRYRVLSQTITNQTCALLLQPRSAAARRIMPHIEIDFDTNNFLLSSTELQFRDGSTMRNDFHDVRLNPKLPPKIFAPTIPTDYTVAEPLANH